MKIPTTPLCEDLPVKGSQVLYPQPRHNIFQSSGPSGAASAPSCAALLLENGRV